MVIVVVMGLMEVLPPLSPLPPPAPPPPQPRRLHLGPPRSAGVEWSGVEGTVCNLAEGSNWLQLEGSRAQVRESWGICGEMSG